MAKKVEPPPTDRALVPEQTDPRPGIPAKPAETAPPLTPADDGLAARVFTYIDRCFGSDAAFERDMGLAPKTVSNWRRGKSAAYRKMLPELARCFDIPLTRLTGRESTALALTPEEEELVLWYRKTERLTSEQRRALRETVRRMIELYLK
ncbi:MAG: hypothetical protein WDA00_03810 [Eubacteriales bacterium]